MCSFSRPHPPRSAKSPRAGGSSDAGCGSRESRLSPRRSGCGSPCGASCRRCRRRPCAVAETRSPSRQSCCDRPGGRAAVTAWATRRSARWVASSRTRSCTSCRRLPMMRMTLTPICGWRWIRSSSSASLQLASKRFGEGDRVGGIAAIGEQRDGPEHLAGPDEADDDLGAVAAGLGDAHAALDHGMGAHTVIALIEDAQILRQAPHDARKRRPPPGPEGGSPRKSSMVARACGASWRWRSSKQRNRRVEEGELFAPAQTGRSAAAVRSRQSRRGRAMGSRHAAAKRAFQLWR